MKLETWAALTHQGPFLEINQDLFDHDFKNNLFMVLDGFGGNGIGDVAAKKIRDDVKGFFTNLASDPNSTMPFYFNPRYLLEENALVNALLNAHQLLFSENAKKNLSSRAGVTGIIALKIDNLMVLISVGNAQAYHFRAGKIEAVFKDDILQSVGNSKNPAQALIPFSAFGMYPELNFQLKEVRLTKGDEILLCTDGIYQWLSDDEMAYSLIHNQADSKNKLNTLVSLSNAHGNMDNQTAMILGF